MAGFFVHQFNTSELQIASITTLTTAGTFTSAAGIKGLTALAYVAGTEGVYLCFGSAPVTALNNAGGASGATSPAMTYVPPGIPMVIGKGAVANFAAITDTGTATLYLHSGAGS